MVTLEQEEEVLEVGDKVGIAGEGSYGFGQL
jgi:hypothetical protein